jgi:hypothetical protein
VPDVLVMKVLLEGMLMDKHDSEYFYQRFASSHHRPVDEHRLLLRKQDADFLVGVRDMINKYLQEQYLLKGIIRIQSIGRGYLLRKQFFGKCMAHTPRIDP